MRIFAISDLHLSLVGSKPMNIFGPAWDDHAEKIAQSWDAQVTNSDLVLVAGDISWAMRTAEALPDMQYLAERPGCKILIRGNHDYWWKREATRRLQAMVDPSVILLQGQSLVFDRDVPSTAAPFPVSGDGPGVRACVGITGTRGWAKEPAEGLDAEKNQKIYERELRYLEAGLSGLPTGLDLKIVMLHYPPFSPDRKPNEFLDLARKHSVDILIYGHLHQPASESRIEGRIDGVQLHLVAVDHLGFKPKLIMEKDFVHQKLE